MSGGRRLHDRPKMSNDLPGFFQATTMPNAAWWETLWPNPAAVISTVGIKAGMDVIDLCCGDGWFTLAIAKIARRVTAVDIDAGMLGLTNIRLNENRIFNCDYRLGDARELAGLAPKPADFVFMANTFHGVGDGASLARTVGETLRPHGRFAIINWHQLPREKTTVLGEPRGPRTELRLSPEQTIEAVEAGGLKSKAIVDIPPFHYAVVFERPFASKAGPLDFKDAPDLR